MTDYSHMSAMLNDAKMMSGLYPFFHLALMNDKLYESAQCSTAFPSSTMVVYLQVVLWRLKSQITM